MRAKIEVGIEGPQGQTAWPAHFRTWAQLERAQLRVAFAHLIALASFQDEQIAGFRTTIER